MYLLSIDKEREDINIDQYPNELGDRVIDTDSELSSIIFGGSFGGISDIETGPDGFLYILSYEEGALYKITRI